tara:strand:- start:235 stop:552 length:318 start_codon:yes stop_codon:yes gene_type:complete
MIVTNKLTHQIDGITEKRISEYLTFGLNLDDLCCLEVVKQYIRDKYPDKDTYKFSLQNNTTLMDVLLETTNVRFISKDKIEDESYNYTVSMEYDSDRYDEIIRNY